MLHSELAAKKLLPELLPYIVNNDNFFDHAIKHSAGGLSPRVKFKDLASYHFYIPNKSKQSELLKLLISVENLSEKYLETANNQAIFKNTLFSTLFSSIGEKESEDLLGIATSSFKFIKFSSICLGSMFGPRFSSTLYNDDGNIASLRTTDIDNDGNVNLGNMPKALLEESKLSEHYLKQGDLVISRSGTIGLAAVFDGYE